MSDKDTLVRTFSEKKTIQMDLRRLREQKSQDGHVASFPHIKELTAAIASNKKQVVLKTKTEPKEEVPLAFKSVDEMMSHSTSEITTVLELLDDVSIHSFDNDVSMSISEISDTHTVQCDTTQKKQGDVMFATGNVFSSNARLLQESSAFSSYIEKKIDTSHRGDDQRFVLLRRILSVSAASSNSVDSTDPACFVYQTEDMHPLEILKAFNITTSTHMPVHLSSSVATTPNEIQSSSMDSNWIDSSLRNCQTDKVHFPNSGTVSSLANGYSIYSSGIYSGSTPFFLRRFRGTNKRKHRGELRLF